jgi:HAMP domain-containing protein
MDADVIGVLLTRFAWFGAAVSFVAWIWVAIAVWRIEGSVHHLVARELSSITLVALDVAIILIFWPAQFIPPPIELNGNEIRIIVAFIVGMQLMAALWQITAPPQGRVRRDGKRWCKR